MSKKIRIVVTMYVDLLREKNLIKDTIYSFLGYLLGTNVYLRQQ